MRILAVLALALAAADPVDDPAVKTIESAYTTVAQKADADAAKIKRGAAEKRLKAYRDLFKKHTQVGELSKASALTPRIEELEAELELLGPDRPAGTVYFGGHGYLFVPKELGWHQAKKYCEMLKGHLAVVDNHDEEEFLLKLCGGKNAWVGATDEKKTNDWKWIDGKGLDVKKLKEVRLENDRGVQHWLAIKQGRTFVDAGMDLRSGFIVEWDK